jgi:hypothetical protein
MKKKTLAAMRESKDWRARLKLAEDKHPGTEFDREFEWAQMSLNPALSVLSRQLWLALGEGLARAIHAGDGVETLHRMADALSEWKRHVPDPDPIRMATISAGAMGRSVVIPTPAGRLRRKRLPDPSVRDALRTLRQWRQWAVTPDSGVAMSDATRNALRNLRIDRNTPGLIRRADKEYGVGLHGQPGRPGKTGTKPH